MRVSVATPSSRFALSVWKSGASTALLRPGQVTAEADSNTLRQPTTITDSLADVAAGRRRGHAISHPPDAILVPMVQVRILAAERQVTGGVPDPAVTRVAPATARWSTGRS